MRIHSRQGGFSIISVMVMLLMIAVMGQGLVSMVGTDNFSTISQMRTAQSQYIAESGIERALYEYGNGTACPLLSYNDPVGAGNYNTTGTLYNPVSTTLSSAVVIGDTIIPMVSIAGYAPHGRVTIESEEIDYGTASNVPAECAPFGAPCLTGAQRGMNGTTPAAHAFGVPVSQNQCVIESTSAVAGFPATAQRMIETSVAQGGSSGSVVQTGTVISNANGTLTVPIPTAVNMTQSFLIFNTRHNSNRPVGSMVRGRIATPGTLEFVRVTNEGTPVPITIRWYVVEFSSGVRVQRGSINQTATVMNVPLATPVASLAQAFVTWSKTPGIGDGIWGQDDPILGDLTATNNLQFRVDNANGNHVIWWQVIEFTNPADILVQRGTTSLTGGGGGGSSVNVTLPTPVDTTKTFVLVGYRTGGTGSDVGRRMLRARLLNPTTINIDRSIAGGSDPITEISWQAVQLNNAVVQHGSENFPVATTPQIAVTFSGTVRQVNAGAISIEDALAGPPEAVATNTNTGSAVITTPIVTLTNNAWLIDVVGSGNAGNFTPGLAQTERWDRSAPNPTSATGASSTKPVSPAGPSLMTQTHNTFSNRNAHAVISIAPDPVPGSITYDTQSDTKAWNTSAINWAHNIGGGSNRKLIVGVAVEENSIVSGDQNVVSMTYNGVPMTFVTAATAISGGFVQHVEIWIMDEASLPPSIGTRTVPIAAVDTTRSVAFASVQPVGGQNMGRSPYTGDDVIGVGSVTMDLTTNLLTMRRDNNADTADIGWFVVEFGAGSGGIIDWLEVF